MSALMNDDIFWTSLPSEPSLGTHVRIHLLIPPRVWLTSSVQDLISGKDKLPPKSNKCIFYDISFSENCYDSEHQLRICFRRLKTFSKTF
ncbi:hypothetical protein P3S68_024159 [Capsicum galapagoense]